MAIGCKIPISKTLVLRANFFLYDFSGFSDEKIHFTTGIFTYIRLYLTSVGPQFCELISLRVIMSQDNNNMVNNHTNNNLESIDLIDVFVQLWKGKVTIIAFTVLAILLAVIYLFVAKEKWTSTAVITQPDAAQIATYNNALNVIYGNTAPNITDVQQRVVGRLSSSLSALSESLDNKEEPEQLTIEPTVKGQALPLKISYVGDTAKNAQTKVAKYIQQVDEQVGEELAVDIQDNIKLQISTLEDSLQTQEKVAQEQKDLRIKQIAEALKFATEAKVASPQLQ